METVVKIVSAVVKRHFFNLWKKEKKKENFYCSLSVLATLKQSVLGVLFLFSYFYVPSLNSVKNTKIGDFYRNIGAVLFHKVSTKINVKANNSF